MKWITEGDYGLCLFFEVTDEQLDKIRDNNEYYKDEKFVVELHSSSGNNAHIYSLVLDKRVDIYKYITMLLDKYDSVSWWNKKNNKFYIRRRAVRCQHQQ